MPIDVIVTNRQPPEKFQEIYCQVGVRIDLTEDHGDEVEMLRTVGLGIAMANAPEEVKRGADAIARSNDLQGVKHMLRQIVFKPSSSSPRRHPFGEGQTAEKRETP